MRPQPIHVTGMIVSRKRARVRHIKDQRRLVGWRADVLAEANFEMNLARASKVPFDPVFREHREEWVQIINEQLQDLQMCFDRDTARARRPFPPELIKQVEEARKEKTRNKQREKERERRGEVTKSMLKRRNLGYPAAVMNSWGDKKKKEMLVVRRSISEVGYVGILKRKMGWRTRPEEDALEGEVKDRVERMEQEIREEAKKRDKARSSQ